MKGSGTAYVQRLGNSAVWTYNSPDFGPGGTRGIPLATSVTRTKSSRSGVDPGPCGGGAPAQDGVYDCPPKSSTFNGLLSWRGRKLNLLTVRGETAPRRPRQPEADHQHDRALADHAVPREIEGAGSYRGRQ